MSQITPKDFMILVVDDVTFNLSALSELLDFAGYQVTFAKNGKEAIASVNENRPDLILLDLMMPIMDGLECCELLKGNPDHADIPILFLTANNEEKNLQKAFKLGAADYVSKPFIFQELLSRVEHQLTISQQRKEINQKNLELEVANQQLKNFNDMICHDIRNPLTRIKGFVQVLKVKMKGALDGETKNFFNYILEGTNQIDQIIKNLVVLSQFEYNQFSLTRVNLSENANHILADLKEYYPQANIDYIVQSDVFIRGDQGLWQMAFENLLNNAWKYSSKQAQATIEFGTIQKQTLIADQINTPFEILSKLDTTQPIYFIRDNGAGFDQKESAKVFEMFQRLHTKNEFDGTGIGLAIVKKIVDFHGGEIWCHGKVNEGATFYFSLPTTAG